MSSPIISALFIYLTVLLTAILVVSPAHGQEEVLVKWSSDKEEWNPRIRSFRSEGQLSKYLTELKNESLLNGNVGFSVDTLSNANDTVHLHVFFGPSFTFKELSTKQTDLLASLGLNDDLARIERRPMNIQAIYDLYYKAITKLENTGYPFASIELNSLSFQDSLLTAELFIDKKRFYTLDSIVIKSEGHIYQKYLAYYLDLKKGMPYSEVKMQRVANSIKEIPFIQSTRSPEIVFYEETAHLFLYLKEKKANTFNGILGVQQDEETGTIQFTGDVELRLVNSIKRGESLYFNWKKLQTQTQRLQVQVRYPFLFGSPFGIEGGLNIYRRDTTFTNIQLEGGLFYQLQGFDYYKVFVSRDVSNQLASTTTFSSLSDTRITYYGVGLHREKLDYRFNPRKGWQVEFDAAAGRKEYFTLNENNEQTETVQNSAVQYNIKGNVSFFIPVGGRGAIKIGANGGWLESEVIFENEMFRIGGIQSLRGFFEESIQANLYAIGTAEFRFVLDENSFASIFYDHAYYENDNTELFISDDPFGVGAGFSFETKAGIFSINYAIGQEFDNPFLIRNSRIHFGFVNLF